MNYLNNDDPFIWSYGDTMSHFASITHLMFIHMDLSFLYDLYCDYSHAPKSRVSAPHIDTFAYFFIDRANNTLRRGHIIVYVYWARVSIRMDMDLSVDSYRQIRRIQSFGK